MTAAPLTRKNVEFAKRVFVDRIGDEYIYGGAYDPFNLSTGADCSGSAGIFIGAAILGANSMSWARQFSTENFPGPFTGFRQVSQSEVLNGGYSIKVCIGRHGGGEDSHMHVNIDGVIMESNGDHGTCTSGAGAMTDDDPYWNTWFAYGGPIIEDGTPRTAVPDQTPTVGNVDTLFSDISEFQRVVDDSYPYDVLSIRVCDGSYQDHNFAQNYAWMVKALDSGKLTMGIVYTYVRPATWASNASTAMAMIDNNGGLHPRVVLMLDVESGGNPGGDQSGPINNIFNLFAEYAGNSARVIGYGNVGDLNNLWPNKPAGVRLIVAGYGNNPDYPGKIAHQYTDGQGHGGGLPEGAAPFGPCDMNSADGLDPAAFATACGIGAPVSPADPTPPVFVRPSDTATLVSEIFDQLRIEWPQLNHHTLVDAVAEIGKHLAIPGYGI